MFDFTFRPTPPLWAVEECEAYYEKMAGKGWLLRRRGALLDLYRRSEPQALRYRLEFTPVKLGGGAPPLPEEQLELYRDCGWALAAKRGEVYVFRAPEDNDVPEIYSEDGGRAAMLAGLKKHYRGDVLGVAVGVGWMLLSAALKNVNLFSWKSLAEADLLLASLFILWSLLMWRSVFGLFMTRRLIREIKRYGVRRGQSRKKRRLVHRTVTAVLAAVLLLCLFGAGAEGLMRTSSPLPDTVEGVPYLLGEEVFNAQRDTEARQVSAGLQTNSVKHASTLFAPVQYHTYERLLTDDGGWGFLYQHVYVTWNRSLAGKLARSLAEDSFFSSAEDFRQVDIPGLDLALTTEEGLELIAVKGDTAVYAIYSGLGDDASARLLEAYADLP